MDRLLNLPGTFEECDITVMVKQEILKLYGNKRSEYRKLEAMSWCLLIL
jgi:hypothetical protein